jgi:hypothetical protein
VACLAPPKFSTLSHKEQDFRGEKKKSTEYEMCVLTSLEILSEKFIILRMIQRDIITKVKSLHVKYTLFLPDFNETFNFLHNFFKKLVYQVSLKSVH